MRLWTELGTPAHGLVAIQYLGLAHRFCGEPDKAAEALDWAIALARDAHNDWGLAWSVFWRAAAATDQDDDALTSTLLDEAASLGARLGDLRVLGLVAHLRSKTALRGGDAELAVELARQAIAMQETATWNEGFAIAHGSLGRGLAALGRPAEALVALHTGLRVAIELGQRYAIAEMIESAAGALAVDDDEDWSAELLGAADMVRAEMGAPGFVTNSHLVEALKAALRRSLGDEVHASALRRGQRRSPRDVLSSLGS